MMISFLCYVNISFSCFLLVVEWWKTGETQGHPRMAGAVANAAIVLREFNSSVEFRASQGPPVGHPSDGGN